MMTIIKILRTALALPFALSGYVLLLLANFIMEIYMINYRVLFLAFKEVMLGVAKYGGIGILGASIFVGLIWTLVAGYYWVVPSFMFIVTLSLFTYFRYQVLYREDLKAKEHTLNLLKHDAEFAI